MDYKLSDPNNKYYKIAIKKEIEIEKSPGNTLPKWPPTIDIHPIVNRYKNYILTGIKSEGECDWYKYFIKKYDSVDIGLTLGTGTGRHQKFLLENGFVKKWDSIDLVVPENEIISSYSQESNLLVNDLNFIKLPLNKYPLIFCHGVLHHIINLEHLLTEINNSLTDNGLFIVDEYVGEDKWQWKNEKIKVINDSLYRKFNDKLKGLSITKINIDNFNLRRPLEAIRSSEIPAIIDKIFNKSIELQFIGFPILYTIINNIVGDVREELLNNHSLLEELLNFSIELDQKHYQNKSLLPNELIGIYKKSKINFQIHTKHWGKKEIKKKLYPKFTIKRFLKQFILIRKIKSFLLKQISILL